MQEIEITIASNFKEIKEIINKFCSTNCYLEIINGEIPEHIDQKEALILKGESELMHSALTFFIDSKKVEVISTDFWNLVGNIQSIIYPKPEDTV